MVNKCRVLQKYEDLFSSLDPFGCGDYDRELIRLEYNNNNKKKPTKQNTPNTQKEINRGDTEI